MKKHQHEWVRPRIGSTIRVCLWCSRFQLSGEAIVEVRA